jgi:hypothetical protein
MRHAGAIENHLAELQRSLRDGPPWPHAQMD